MFGKKKSFETIKSYLKNELKIKNISDAKFCQGNTMRWGIAWSFHEDKLKQFDYFHVLQ